MPVPLCWTASPSLPLLGVFIKRLSVKPLEKADLTDTARKHVGRVWERDCVDHGDPGRTGSLEATRGQDLYLIHKVRRVFEVIIFLFFSLFSPLSRKGNGSELSKD